MPGFHASMPRSASFVIRKLRSYSMLLPKYNHFSLSNLEGGLSMCNSGESDLNVNEDEDYSEDELDSREDYSEDEFDGDEDSSRDDAMYNGDESDGEESDGVAFGG
jgi:hypothetical protein